MSFYIQDASAQSLKKLNDFLSIIEKKIYDNDGSSLRENSVSTDAIQNQAITTGKVGLLAITSPLIDNSAIIAAKIAESAIQTEHIKPLAVTEGAIAGEAITSEKIAALAILADHIAANAITTDKLSANCITSEKIGANQIYSDHIVADQILANHIKAGAVESDSIAANAILANHIQAEQIQTNHIATGAVTTNKIASDVGSSLDISSNISITSRVTSEEHQADLQAIQLQLDGKIETFYTDTDPNVWLEADRTKHNGDLWYNTSLKTLSQYNGTTNSWQSIENQDAIDAMTAASNAQDTADGKRRVFIATPTVPYDIGDLWTEGENGELKRCITSKTINDTYSASDWVLATKYTDDSTFNTFFTTQYQQDMANLQALIDGNISTWFYDYNPTTSNEPASLWTDTATKNMHLGDLFYNTTSGDAYRYVNVGGTYQWNAIQDTTTTQALQTAQNAYDIATDHKRRVFIATPTVPYDIGDLWLDTNKDLNRCITSKIAGQSYSSLDWEKATKYTDDTVIDDFVNNTYNPDKSSFQSQIDGKIETFFQTTDPNTWVSGDRLKHTGDMWFKSDTKTLFRYNGTTNTWEQVQDQKAIDAYNNASTAQSTANSKRTVFTAQPTVPYLVGDLWLTSTTAGQGDIYKCITARSSGSYTDSEWVLATKYTDNTVANQAKASADTANNLLADFTADNKLTQSEKLNIKTEFDTIISEKPTLDSKADNYLITTEKTTYDTSYTDLYNYINPILNVAGTSDIVGDTLRLKFKNYYDARLALIQKMTDISKGIADYAKNVADTLKNTTFPGLESRVTTAEEKITDDAIIQVVITSESYLGNTKLANYTPLIVTRDNMTLNPLQCYNFNGGTVFAPNEMVKINTGVQTPTYSGELNILDDNIVTFTHAVDKVKVMETEISQQDDKISLVVTETENGNVVNSASIVASINDGTSKIAMSAMDIDLTGLVTFNSFDEATQESINASINNATSAAEVLSDWKVPNKATINGAYIEAGTLKINQILMGGENGNISWGSIDKLGATATDVGARPSTWVPYYYQIAGSKPPTNADNTSSIIGPNRLTYIDANGIYTGTLTAYQINAIEGIHLAANATIDWNLVTAPNAEQVGAKDALWEPDLTDYVTSTTLNTTLNSYALSTDLEGFIKSGDVTSALMGYLKESTLTTLLGSNFLITGKIAAEHIISGTLDCVDITVKNLSTSSLIGDVIALSNNCSLDSRGGDARLRYDNYNYVKIGRESISFYMGNAVSGYTGDYDFYTDGIYFNGTRILKSDGSSTGGGGTLVFG